jgi:hypothetical protein
MRELQCARMCHCGRHLPMDTMKQMSDKQKVLEMTRIRPVAIEKQLEVTFNFGRYTRS